MHLLIIPRSLRAVVILTALLAAVAAAILFTARDQTYRPSLIGVPAEAYDGSTGIELRSTPENAPLISADEAIRATDAVNGYRRGSVRQVVLARKINANTEPDMEKVVWVLNFDPSTVNWHQRTICGLGCAGIDPESMETTHALLFIDAETGEEAGGLLSGCQRLDFGALDPGIFGARQRPLNPCP